MNHYPNKKSIRKEIYITAGFFSLFFIGMIIYLIGFMKNDSKDFIYNSYNSRFSVFADDVSRGSIYTADGVEIAKTSKDSEGKEVRVYPDDRLFCHAVGYVGKGMSGLEAEYSFDLLKSHISLDEQINNSLTGTKSPGDSLYTTFDYETQKAASDGLKMFDGAVIAIEPSTGKIIAMVSKPDYSPNTIAEKWEEINDSTNKNTGLMNRATNGSYPPGSTFKIITTLAYLRATGNDDFSYNCRGNFKVDDYTIHCSGNKSHGQEDLLKAFSNSCNSAYASMGVELDRDEFTKTAEDLLFNTTLPTMLNNTRKSSFKIDDDTKESIVAQTAIGQGQTAVTPLHMCMIVSAIANDGNLMKPYMADKIVSANGEVISQTEPESYDTILSQNEVNLLNSYMEAVVMDGTAEKVDFGDLEVYGKTGTAEYTSNKKLTHSWFVGYAKNEYGKKLAIAVIMESAGYGSKYAAPLAADVFNAYFDN
ncbi:peptidoglycan glycosyltransferase [Pseudobutyrivibrio sp. YE44]|uniref:peptidoglycan D,D-transpeptidase FtsI family protein n=1 Tax=Pseudobutyrivibrio sp. YE44 TaxID=1520802 RepID=UPI00088C989D|nr:penicillin-binding transpeptidase domain-containing protein [Pseudobutyrivibrio sp. YE44]SDB09151.1 peptidoglycan glycosyltransferase [Pseudobutyrivibrio sp. YE44]